MPTRPPNDAEIYRAAEQMGLLVDGQVPRGKRKEIAATLQLAADTERNQAAVRNTDAEFTTRIGQMYADLRVAGVDENPAARVLGAISAQLRRELQEKETAQ